MNHTYTLPPTHSPHPTSIKVWRIACAVSTLAFLITQVFGGLIRWVLDMIGAAALAYIPNLMMLCCIGFILFYELRFQLIGVGSIFFLCLLALSIIVGFYNIGNIKQVIFGLWVLTPFLFGLACAPAITTNFNNQHIILLLLMLIAGGGVVVHSLVELPWVGLSYTVGGVELEGAREWQTTGGSQRLSGFARSSFDVAGQVILLASLLSLHLKSGWLRVLLWCLCTYAISLSTSKGILLALLMTIIASEALIRAKLLWIQLIFLAGIFWLFLPPILGWAFDWSEAARTDIDNPLYGSFIDRMNDMWPRALELITLHGQLILGRGLGGIGVPVSIYEPLLANAGDNVFVYCLVILGFISIPLFFIGFIMVFKMGNHFYRHEVKDVIVLAVIINWYGGVSNILEHAVLGFAMGIVCRYLSLTFSGEIQTNKRHLI